MSRLGSRVLAGTVAATAVTAGLIVAGAGPASAESVYPTQALDRLTVLPEAGATGYSPGAFPHWVDADGDGCDTRVEVLRAESQTQPQGAGCSVTGPWLSWLDGQTVTDPAQLAVDQTVPTAEAWQSGAASWTTGQRQAFANDLADARSLNVVTATVQSERGSRDPAEWTPRAEASCTYATAWVAVKYRWHLAVDEAERSALSPMLASCGSSPMELPARADVPDPQPSPAESASMADGQVLLAGEWLMSPDRTHGLTLQADGNLVAYGPRSRVLWSSHTYGNPGAVFTVQPDGNAVVYAADGRALWHAGTYGNPGAVLRVQNDGNVVLYRSNGSAAWYTGWDRTSLSSDQSLTRGQQITSANGRYSLVLQPDGNAVVYAADGRPLFFTGSYGAYQLTLQSDGNLVAYSGVGQPLWNSDTWREGRTRLDVQDDGNVVLYRADGTPAWYSGWDAGQWATSPGRGTYVPRPAPVAPAPQRPGNPGDAVNCGDFATWRAAQDWFDTYYPSYGDVARLDDDGDRIACESLPGHP